MSKAEERAAELRATLKWIAERIDQEEIRVLRGKRPNWAKAIREIREETHAAVSVTDEWRRLELTGEWPVEDESVSSKPIGKGVVRINNVEIPGDCTLKLPPGVEVNPHALKARKSYARLTCGWCPSKSSHIVGKFHAGVIRHCDDCHHEWESVGEDYPGGTK